MLTKVNLRDKLASFEELWVPKVVGELNGQMVKVVKFKDEYVWHSHEHEDELFLVLEGRMDLQLEDGTLAVEEGEFVIVPHGVRHRPTAQGVCQVLLFEPASTRNTGEVDHGYTIEPEDLDRI